MKYIPTSHLHMLASLLLAFSLSSLHAQEQTEEPAHEDEEVERILGELAADNGPEENQPPQEDWGQEVVPHESEDVPMIHMDDHPRVEGIEIQPSQHEEALMSITLDEVFLSDVISIFARAGNANIVIPDGLDQSVSANLHDVHWQEALEVILEDNGFALVQRRPGIFTVVEKDRLAAEPLSRETIELKYITVEQALPAVEGMIITSNARVMPLPAANVLIVVETRENIREIREIITLVDKPREQVFIEAKFVELNDQAIKDLGINWQVLQGYTVRASDLRRDYERIDSRIRQDAAGSQISRMSSQVDTSPASTTENRVNFRAEGRNFESIDATSIEVVPAMERNIAQSAVLSVDDFALTLSALQQLDGVRIVSNPKMLVASGETSTIHVGRNEPNIRAIPQGETANTFAYVLDGFIEIGVKLEVTPVVSTAKNITVGIIPELSRLISEKSVGEAGTSFPVTQIRRIETEFAVESGKTVAIGGLTQGEDKEVVKKVPLLGDLPLIGKYLFRHTRTERFQDEIIIFVTVDMAHVGDLNDQIGLPDEGELIHHWLNHKQAERAATEAARRPPPAERNITP